MNAVDLGYGYIIPNRPAFEGCRMGDVIWFDEAGIRWVGNIFEDEYLKQLVAQRGEELDAAEKNEEFPGLVRAFTYGDIEVRSHAVTDEMLK